MTLVNLIDSSALGAWTFCKHAKLGVLRINDEGRCMDCKSERTGRWRESNPEHAKQWREAHPGYDREWAAKDPDRRRRVARAVRGVTNPEVFDKLFEAQGHVCAICGTADFGGKTPCLDHVHGPDKRGPARGVLCSKCNSGIGLLNDSPELVRKALQHLERSL